MWRFLHKTGGLTLHLRTIPEIPLHRNENGHTDALREDEKMEVDEKGHIENPKYSENVTDEKDQMELARNRENASPSGEVCQIGLSKLVWSGRFGNLPGLHSCASACHIHGTGGCSRFFRFRIKWIKEEFEKKALAVEAFILT